MNRCLKRSVMLLAAILLGCGQMAMAQSKTDPAQAILQELVAGRDATALIKQYRDSDAASTSPALDRTIELRQLREAESTLAQVLRALQKQVAPDALALQPSISSYQQWQAALLLLERRQQGVTKILQKSNASSAYLARHQQVVAGMQARAQRIQQLLEPFLMSDEAKTEIKNQETKQASKANKSGSTKLASTKLASTNSANTKLSSANTKPMSLQAASSEALVWLNQSAARSPHEAILHAVNLPVGSLNLATRKVQITPQIVPSYADAAETAVVAADTAQAPEAPLNDEILQKAKALDNDYLRIYEFVRNSHRSEWYAGSVKGALGTLRSGAGNDVDQASLLLALLRATGVPGRYVHGVVELPLEKLANDLGLTDRSQVPAALTKAGIAFQPVTQGGRVSSVQMQHTWISAHVPYTNYRGAVVDASGKSWIPLDPWFKDNAWTPAKVALADLAEAGSAAALQNDYLAQAQSQPFAQFVGKRVQDFLQARDGGAVDYAAQLGRQQINPLNLDLLPNSLPYSVLAVTREDAQLAPSDLVQAHIVMRSAGNAGNADAILDVNLPLHEISNQRFTLSYLPASLEDHRLTLAFGGLDVVPLYLIKLRPQLNLGGKVRAIGSSGIDAGSDLMVEIVIQGPFGSQRITQTVMAGTYQALGIAGSSATRPAVREAGDNESQAARLLDGIALAYHQAWSEGEAQLAALTGVKLLRPVPAVLLVANQMDVLYLDEATPQTLVWKGVTLDAASHPLEAVGANASDFIALSALHGSSLEAVLFQRQFSVEAISADKGLALAKQQGLALLSLNSGNVGSIDGTDHRPAVKDNIRNLVRLGYRVDVPASRLSVSAWQGSVWRAQEKASGASGYFISGSLAGGATVTPAEAWALSFLADALRAPNSDPYNIDSLAGVTVLKLGAGDEQTGTVGQTLAQPLSVIVLDKEGMPIKGAPVRFQVMAGGATLGGGAVFETVTNALGIAVAKMKLGTQTSSNPLYTYRNKRDANPTRVSLNLVDVVAASTAGSLHIEAPFSAIAYPDVMAALRRATPAVSEGTATEWVDSIIVKAEDQYGNPLPNIGVKFAIQTQLVCPSDNSDKYFKPGAVFDNLVKDGGSMVGCSASLPRLGDCGQPSLSKDTDSEGSASAGVILGNDVKGKNTLDIRGGSFSLSYVYTAWGRCNPAGENTSVDFATMFSGGTTLINSEGANASGAKPSTQFNWPLSASVGYTDWPYEVRYRAGKAYLYFFPYISVKPTNASVNFSVSGGGFAAGAAPKGVGLYETKVTVGGSPFAHVVKAQANNIVVKVPIIAEGGGLEIVDDVRSAETGVSTVYAVVPKIDKVVAEDGGSKIYIDSGGKSASQLDLQYFINPAGYTALGVDLNLYENGNIVGYFNGDKKAGSGSVLIPRGQPFNPKKTYEAELVLSRGSVVEMKSEKFQLETRQKLITSAVGRGAKLEADVLNKRACEVVGGVFFGFSQDVSASLKLETLDGSGQPTGEERVLFSDKPYGAGNASYPINAGVIGSGQFRFTLTAKGVSDPTQVESVQGGLSVLYQLANRLPVGQVIVKGVMLKDGSLVAQTQALALAGRGPVFHFQPTYSSSSNGKIGTMGTNWTHNFESSLHINSCGEVVVSAGDGGSVRFFPAADGKLVPDLGYHGTLEYNTADLSYDFFSKDGTHYHYKFINNQVQWKLDFIEDTNGNRLTLNYDFEAGPEPLLVNVKGSDGREFNFKYALQVVNLPGVLTAHSFLTQVTGSGGLMMDFTHDEFGNLTAVNRNGRKETFGYQIGDIDFKARALMVSATDPNGNRTGYNFNKFSTSFTTGGGVLIVMPNSMVTSMATPTGTVTFDIEVPSFLKTTVTNENGQPTTYAFNPYGSPLSIRDPAGETKMTWASDDINMVSKTDARGVTTDFTYDKQGNLLTESVAGSTISNTYLVQGTPPYIKNRLTRHTDRNGNETAYTYDGKGNRLREDMPNGVSVQHTYAGNGDLLQTTDGNGGTSKFLYDGSGNLSRSTNPVAASINMTRDARGRVRSSTDGKDNTTLFEYDAQDRITSRQDAMGKKRQFRYDNNDNKLSETDEAGRTTSMTYSALNLPTSIKHADGNSKQISYDAVGNKVSETDFRGNTTTYSYDGVNRLISRLEPLSKKTAYVYDQIGNLTTETDALGRNTQHSYNSLSQRISTTDGAKGVWKMDYDGNGNKLSSTDPLGRVTTMRYDGLNRLTSVEQALGRTTRYSYDKNSNKVTENDANGNTASYEYDAANRMLSMADTNGKKTSYEYDKNNNLQKSIDPNLNVTLYSYDALNRKRDMKDGAGYVTTYAYDEVGNLTTESLPNDNVLSHGYDNLNRRVSTVDALGQVAAFDYDADGNKTSETDANGNIAFHTWNALNQMTASALPADRNMSFEYDLMNNRTSMSDARGNRSSYQFDALNRMVEMIDAKGGSHRTSYDKVGNKLTETDARGNTTTYTYDDLNRTATVSDALGKVVTYSYDAIGNKIREVNKRGVVTVYTYDKMHRLLTVNKDDIVIAKNQYDDGGNVLTTTDANSNITNYEYDKRNLRIAENRLLAAITRFKLDAMGDVITSTDPEARITTNSYDKRRRLVATSNGAGETTMHTYDGVGNRTSSTRALGNVTRTTWDAANRAIDITDPVGHYQYEYDKNSNHTAFKDANGNLTRYSFDELNRRVGVVYPGGASESFSYDANGNLINHTDGNGTTVTHLYDALNRETGKTYSASADGLGSIITSYDANNNVVAVAQHIGNAAQQSSYGYDNFDRQQSHTDPFGAKVITTYDANGNKTSMITQDGKVSRYSYDALNRVAGIVGQSGSIGYAYDRSSLNTAITYSNGVSSKMSYDAAKRVKTVIHSKGSNALSRTEYDYDKNGNRTREVINRVAGAQVTNYGYDNNDRLTQTSVIDAAKTVTSNYTLDAVSNRTQEAVTTTPAGGSSTSVTKTYTYDGRNQLTAIADSTAGNITLGYDRQGNLRQKTQGSDITAYSYNARDNLISISKNSTVLGSYGNDHLGLRVEKEAKDPLQPGAPPVKFRTLWDGRNAFQDSDTNGVVTTRYETDGRHPVSMWSKDDGSQALHHDALGSIVATTDSAGALKSETIYDAFGNVQEETGQSANKFGYTGHQMDKESGLIYFQARYYDPQIGRFITQDPFEGDWMTPMSLHHYLYAYGNPTVYTDPSGKCVWDLCIAEIAVGALIVAEGRYIVDQLWGTDEQKEHAVKRAAIEGVQAVPKIAVAAIGGASALAVKATVQSVRAIGATNTAYTAVNAVLANPVTATYVATEAVGTALAVSTGAVTPSSGLAAPESAAARLAATEIRTEAQVETQITRVMPSGLTTAESSTGSVKVSATTAPVNQSVPAVASREIAVAQETTGVRRLTPADFGRSIIAENPEHLRMWNDAMKSAATSQTENGYMRYLNALERGETPNKKMLEAAFDAVNKRFVESARAAGNDIAQVHHWNFAKTDFPTQIVDPRHLVPTPSRAAHQELHEATSATSNFWVGPIAPEHEIHIPEWSTPLAPRK